jgi:tRNA threonylcarbamoyladenosine biosynthesis protein TsaE
MLRMPASPEPHLLIESRTPSQTEALARGFSKLCPAGAVIYLKGDLGSGKSTFARALLHALGIDGPIKSPTYTLIETYALDNALEAVHMDLYRIADPDEINYLALDAFADKLQIMLVEWPEKGIGHLPAADIEIGFEHAGDARRIQLFSGTPQGRKWLVDVTGAESKPWLNEGDRAIIKT